MMDNNYSYLRPASSRADIYAESVEYNSDSYWTSTNTNDDVDDCDSCTGKEIVW